MSLKNFLYTLKRIGSHPTVGISGLRRHLQWQIKRSQTFQPFTVEITSRSVLKMSEPSDVNGCVALAWSMGKYDFNNMSFILDVLDQDQHVTTFFDVGANIGTYALIASEAERVTVHSFEPHPQTARVLAANIEHNGRKNIIVHQLALSDQNGTVSFQDDKGSPLNQVLEAASDTSIEVQRLTMDEFCRRSGVKPQLMKIDIEGHELEAIKGMQNSLDECCVIFLEENHNAQQTLETLPAGFSGPYYLDFSAREISRGRCNCYEDALYVNDALIQSFCEKNGYCFTA